MSDIHDLDDATIEQLREKADQASKLEAQLAQLTNQKDRELAMLRAGIPTESKVGQAFLRDYDGELEADKIKESAVEWGLWKPEGSDATDDTPPDPTAVDREKLRSGNVPSDTDPPKPHPSKEALRKMREAQESGLPQENTRIRAITDMIAAAIDGDQRMIIRQASGMERTSETEAIGFQTGRRGVDG